MGKVNDIQILENKIASLNQKIIILQEQKNSLKEIKKLKLLKLKYEDELTELEYQ